MGKKFLLITSCLLATAPAIAAERYQHCFSDNSSEVCQAFLAGVDSRIEEESVLSKVSITLENGVVEPVEAEETFASRALEQRAGERFRKPLLLTKQD